MTDELEDGLRSKLSELLVLHHWELEAICQRMLEDSRVPQGYRQALNREMEEYRRQRAHLEEQLRRVIGCE